MINTTIRRRELLAGLLPSAFAAAPPAVRIERSLIYQGRDAAVTYFQPRVCVLPGNPPSRLFMTSSPVTGNDVFWNLHASESTDAGRTWSKPAPLPGLTRTDVGGGITEELLADAVPDYHPQTRTLIILGDNVYYAPDGKTQTRRPGHRWQQPVYMVRDAKGNWAAPRKLEWADPRASAMFNCGNSQRVTLPDGGILLALSHTPEERYRDGALGPRGKGPHPPYDRAVTVTRCSFDGTRMEIREASKEFRLPVKRGLIEPSLTSFGGRFFLTLRAEDGRGYTSVSANGLDWEPMRPWAWDDGTALEMSTTQQHWLSLAGRLYLVYTRRSTENEKVPRWRAPLYLAQVDPERLCLKRATEQIVFPMLPDARMGNFHTLAIGKNEAAVFCTEESSEAMHWKGNTLMARLRPA